MTFEFGYDPNEEDEVKINEMISKIEKRFNFILINEFMAESLIVLKRYLCMDLPGKITIGRNLTPIWGISGMPGNVISGQKIRELLFWF